MKKFIAIMLLGLAILAVNATVNAARRSTTKPAASSSAPATASAPADSK